MKHTYKVVVALVLFFFMAQFAGLLIINHYIDHKKTFETKIVEWKPLPYSLERPELKNQSASFIYITIAIFIGTIFVLLLARFNKTLIWKLWFFMTVWITLSLAFAAFINNDIRFVAAINTKFSDFFSNYLPSLSFMDNFAAAAIAFAVSLLKLYKPGLVIQNLSEIFIYGGLAAIFVPMMNLFAGFMLLIVISIYDFVAVFRTKHMIRLAKFQSESKVFAGLLIPYAGNRAKSEVFNKKISINNAGKSRAPGHEKEKSRIAVLGGGDIGFTLIFAGVVMKGLMLQETVLAGFLKSLFIPVAASLALFFLLMKGRQNKFYPAMPVLSLGCFMGYLIILLI